MYTYNLFKLPHSSVHEVLKLDILTTLNIAWVKPGLQKSHLNETFVYCLVFGHCYTLDITYIFWLYILSSYSFIIQLTFWRIYYMTWKTRYGEHVKSGVNCVARHSHVRTQMRQHRGHVKAFSRLEKISLPSWSKCKCRQCMQEISSLSFSP